MQTYSQETPKWPRKPGEQDPKLHRKQNPTEDYRYKGERNLLKMKRREETSLIFMPNPSC